MAMEPENEPLTAPTTSIDMQEDEDIGLSGSLAQVNNEPGVNVFARDELAFVNTSGGDLLNGDEPTEVSSLGSVWLQLQANMEKAKAFKTSMTSDLAPWTQFADRSKFSTPSKTEIFGRVKGNLKVYYANYTMLLGALAVWIMISNLYFVVAMLMSVGSYYYYRLQTNDGSVFMFRGRQISPAQFYPMLIAFTVLLFWLTGGGSTVFWMLASALVVVLGHASFREVSVDLSTISDEQAFGAFSQLAQQV